MKLTEVTNQFLTNHDEIKAWLDEMGIENYTIASDGKVSVKGKVYLYGKYVTSIPVQFDKVDGAFDCSYVGLKSMVGCPTEVGGTFDCGHNGLTSLKGCPTEVGGTFDCIYNNLTSLVDCPTKVSGNFYCNENKLTSLVGCPTNIGGGFDCCKNKLTSLVGCPTVIGGNFYCYDNELTSLVDCPTKVSGNFYCNDNRLTSLVGISDLIESVGRYFVFDADEIKTGGLGLLLIKDIQSITTQDGLAFDIIKKYIGHPDKIFKCQQELIEAGFDEFAQL